LSHNSVDYFIRIRPAAFLPWGKQKARILPDLSFWAKFACNLQTGVEQRCILAGWCADGAALYRVVVQWYNIDT